MLADRYGTWAGKLFLVGFWAAAMSSTALPLAAIFPMVPLPVFAIGVLNLFLVHPVPGIVGLLLSLVYFPPATALLKEKTGWTIPPAIKISTIAV